MTAATITLSYHEITGLSETKVFESLANAAAYAKSKATALALSTGVLTAKGATLKALLSH